MSRSLRNSYETRPRRLSSLIVIALVAALALTGCSSSKEKKGSGGAKDSSGTPVDEGTPQSGGKLVVALEAETDGWNPTANRWATSGMAVARALYDPLAAIDAEGQVHPYLAESIEPNEDYTVWTVKLRPGVVFHDGSALDAAAVKLLYDSHLASFLSGPALSTLESVDATDDLTATFNMKAPWASFPYQLAGQLGYVPAASTLAEGGGDKPVGTGPFEFVSWQRDNNLVVKANKDYWREELPYLDEIEFRTITDPIVRSAAFEGGEVDVLMTTDTEAIVNFREQAENGDVQFFEDAPSGEGEEFSVMLNTAKAPLDDIRVRRALALGTDREQYTETADDGVHQIANGPFMPDSRWYSPVRFPEFNLESAKGLIADYEDETGTSVKITLRTTPGPVNLESTQELAGQWKLIGVDTEIKQVTQSEFVSGALTGDFDANLWRQFDGVDPDIDYMWWHSSNAADIGGIGLNFARNKDPELDAALDAARAEPDFEKRKEYYATVVERLNEDLPYIWLNHNIWSVAMQDDVRGMTKSELPDESPALVLSGGKYWLTQVWLDR